MFFCAVITNESLIPKSEKLWEFFLNHAHKCSHGVCFVIKKLSCLKKVVCISERRYKTFITTYNIKIKQPKANESWFFFQQKLASWFLKSCKLSIFDKIKQFSWFFLPILILKQKYVLGRSNFAKKKNRTGLFGRILINWGIAKKYPSVCIW